MIRSRESFSDFAVLPLRTMARTGPSTTAERSPLYVLLAEGRTFARWRLHDDPDAAKAVPALLELRAEGGTDYVLHLMWFAPGTAGVAISFATNRPSGFSDDDMAILAEVLPALGLAMCKVSLSRTLHETLATYLGSETSTRVLNGCIRRGEGETVAAAILLADFRSFTALTDRDDALRVVGWLDEHFDAIGEPVARRGGEILKFMGDGFLAIFPVSDPNDRPCATCGNALDVAEQALALNRALNDRRRAAGLPGLDVDLVLHFGRVIYGNVGTSRRLDFTVIGRAVNEASRIEELCETRGIRFWCPIRSPNVADVSWSWSARLPCAGLNASSRSGRRYGHRTLRWRTANRVLRKRPSRFISGYSDSDPRPGSVSAAVLRRPPSGRLSAFSVVSP